MPSVSTSLAEGLQEAMVVVMGQSYSHSCAEPHAVCIALCSRGSWGAQPGAEIGL